MTILSNHPSSEWKDWDSPSGLVEGKNLNRDIRFNGLISDDCKDHENCFLWEYNRTRIERGVEAEGEHLEISFPFYVKSFPDKPYESHASEQRRKWCMVKGTNSHDSYDNLFTEDLGTKEEVDIGSFKGKLPSSKAPVTLYLNPNWSKQKVRRLVKEQMDAIFNMLNSRKRLLERDGYVFKVKSKSRPMSYWKTRLKLLGHYRLNECVGLSWLNTMKAFGEKPYEVDAKYRTLVKALLPHLSLN
jgi:hypothetical protein